MTEAQHETAIASPKAQGTNATPQVSDDEFARLIKLYEGTLGTMHENEVIKGTIVSIVGDDVSIDIGFKSEGIVNKSEFLRVSDLKIGDTVEVFLEKIEDKDGRPQLSRKRADFLRTWEKLNNAFTTQEVLQVQCLRRIKGGLVVNLLGIEAFLPGSQIDVRPVRDFDAYIDKTLDIRIVKITNPTENIIVSHKILLEEHLNELRKAILDKLDRGQILEGSVKAITDFGAFVDLGGVDGLVHITDLSWGRVSHPSEVVKLDQTVQVVVLDFDENKKRISLGLKQLQPHPWEKIEEKYAVGQHIHGKIVSLTDYGAFIEIEKGIEGLVHISEMSWTQHIKHPSQIVSMGQVVEAVILNIDKNEKKISLGMKQTEPDPWGLLLDRYPIGSIHKAIVRNITNFGIFVELEEGVDGLIHISDLSWTKKIRHPGEVVKKGDQIDVIVLAIDAEQRRISLGHKQLSDNPWEQFEDAYNDSAETEGTITLIMEKGVIVELPLGVEGFVPTSQLSFTPVKHIAEYFKVGDKLPLKVIEFDKEGKKIVLSVVEYLRSKEQGIIDEFVAQHPVPQATLGEVAQRKTAKQGKGKRENNGDPTEQLLSGEGFAAAEGSVNEEHAAEMASEAPTEERPTGETESGAEQHESAATAGETAAAENEGGAQETPAADEPSNGESAPDAAAETSAAGE